MSSIEQLKAFEISIKDEIPLNNEVIYAAANK